MGTSFEYLYEGYLTEDGLYLILKSDPQGITIWELATMTCVRTIKASVNGWISENLACFQDMIFCSENSSHDIIIWQMSTGQEIRRLRGHTGVVLSLFVHGSYLISGDTNHTIRIWNWTTGQLLHTNSSEHSSNIRSVVGFEGKGVSAAQDHKIKIWDLMTGRVIQTIDGAHAWRSVHVYFGKIIAVGEGGLQIFNAYTYQEEKIVENVNKEFYTSFCYGNFLIAGATDHRVYIWDLNTGAQVRNWEAHDNDIRCVFVYNGILVTVNYSRSVKIWQVPELQFQAPHYGRFDLSIP